MPPKPKRPAKPLPPPQMTFWMYSRKGVAIPEDEAHALRCFLEECVGAKDARVLGNGAVHAAFRSWADLERAHRECIGPLRALLSNPELRAAYTNPFDAPQATRSHGPRRRTSRTV